MSIRERVCAILMSPPCQKIDFQFENVHITGSWYEYLAIALWSPAAPIADYEATARYIHSIWPRLATREIMTLTREQLVLQVAAKYRLERSRAQRDVDARLGKGRANDPIRVWHRAGRPAA